MELKEKIDFIIKEKGISQRKFAELIGLNHISFNRNMKNNNITGEIIKALIENLKDIDLNWLFKNESFNVISNVLNEPKEDSYSINKIKKIDDAIKLLEDFKKDLSQ